MPDTPSGSSGKPMKQPNDDLSEAMGNLSVTADNSVQTSTPKNLSDMPFDVARLIIDKSDFKKQLVLRKMSKSLRALVDEQKPACTILKVLCTPNYIFASYNENEVIYASTEYYLPPWTNLGNPAHGIVNDDYEKMALNDLASTLKNPRLRLETFSFKFDDLTVYSRKVQNKYKKIRNIINKINHQISARECEIQVASPFKYRSILPFLKPGVLEKISLEFDAYEDWKNVDTIELQISHLEQWKQATELKLVKGFEDFPMEYATHFKRFHLVERELDDWHLFSMADHSSATNHFEYCLMEAEHPLDVEKLNLNIREGAPLKQGKKYVGYYSIPDSDNYLVFQFFEKSIEIRKMKR